MKFLNGAELAGFIKERHAKQVRSLLGSGIGPKLAIVQVNDDPVINTYVGLKQKYGADIGVEVDVHKLRQEEVPALLDKLNKDKTVSGIIVQLPLTDKSQTDEIVNLVSSGKDVDALGKNANYEPATPMAILWLLAGYNIELLGKQVLLIGRGKLVGAPLEQMLKKSGINLTVIDKSITSRLAKTASESEVIIAAANAPHILTASMIMPGAAIVDAGSAEASGKVVGNVSPEVYERHDITITPKKGGVGPLTVCALFENVIKAAADASKS